MISGTWQVPDAADVFNDLVRAQKRLVVEVVRLDASQSERNPFIGIVGGGR